MNRSTSLAALAALSLLLLSAACSKDSSPTLPRVQTASVTFTYISLVPPGTPEPLEPPGSYLGCVHHNQNSKLVGNWSASAVYRDLAGDCYSGCAVTVPDVPVNLILSVYMMDLDLCKLDPTGTPIAYHRLFANGVELTREMDNPGFHGVTFTVDETGRVTP